MRFSEADVEAFVLDWLAALGWQVAHGPDIAPDTPNAERNDYGQVVLERRLRDVLAALHMTLAITIVLAILGLVDWTK